MSKELSIKIIDVLTEEQKHDLIALYRNEFWCNKRQFPDVERMLGNTDIIIGAENERKKLIGFVRILTNYIYRATVYDLIVDPEYRKTGLGAFLMEQIINHPKLSEVGTLDLTCLPEMNDFYEKWDFTKDLGELTLMRRFNRKN